MKNKQNWLGMLVIILVFGIMVVGCDNGTTEEGGASGKKLTINGIGLSGNVTVIINTEPTAGTLAYGTTSNSISGSNVTFNLKVVDLTNMSNPFTNNNWNGASGLLYILVYNQTPQWVADPINYASSPDRNFTSEFADEITILNW